MSTPASTEAPAPSERTSASGPSRIGELVFAGLAFALGAFVLVGAFGIRVPDSANAVGPTAFPFLVSGILMVSALGVAIDVLRGRGAVPDDGEDVDGAAGTDWPTLAKIVIAVVLHIILVPLIGWAFAAALLFGIVGWALGATRWWVAGLVGLALGLVIQVVFGLMLGLSLPLGPVLGPVFSLLGA